MEATSSSSAVPNLYNSSVVPTVEREGIPLEKGVAITERFLENNYEVLCKWADFFLAYPDKFLDIIADEATGFKLFLYQRVFLRVAMRFRYVYATFTRAYSKSFLSVLTLILRCIFLPNSKLFICADVKTQAVRIANEKKKEIFYFFPLIKNELVHDYDAKDSFRMVYLNGSVLDVVGTADSDRGGRRTGGLIEEIATIRDGDAINDVVLPLMNVNRRDGQGWVNPKEPHQAQIYVTTAGNKASYAYERLLELLILSVLKPESAFVWGGTYRVPVHYGLLDKNYIDEIRLSSTYRSESFGKEYLSIWSGGSSETWVDIERLNKYRTILRAEKRKNIPIQATNIFYILSVDVGRYKANSAITVLKCLMQENRMIKRVVWTEVMHDQHMNDQAVRIKRLIQQFDPIEVVIDGTGIGAGLIDAMTGPTHDHATGEVLPGYGIINDPEYKGLYDRDAPKIIYRLMINSALNSEIHSNMYTMLHNGSVRFLVNELTARGKLLSTQSGQRMSVVKRAEKLLPYENTSRLFDELANLRAKISGASTVTLEKISRRLEKDRVSSLEYALWRAKFHEDKYFQAQRKSTRRIDKFILFTPKGGRK